MKMKANHRFDKQLNGEHKMNKTITTIVLASMLLLSAGFVVAEPVGDGTGVNHDAVVAAGGQNGTGLTFQQLNQIASRVQAGNYVSQDGKQIQIQAEGNNGVRLRVQNAEAHTSFEITYSQENGKTRMNVQLSNGRNAEIKVMPDIASERALQRLRLKNCNESNNCSIELKQVGQGEQARLAYEVQAERHSRILGLFAAKMQVRAQVDAETGETIGVGKPWWAFLATEPEEQ
jgi:hypothetical protein